MDYILAMIYTVGAIMVLILLYMSIYKSSEEKTTLFSFLVLHVFIYLVGVIMELRAVDILQVKVAYLMKCLGIPFVAVYLLLFVCDFAEITIKNKLVLASVFVIPVLSAIIVANNTITGLYYGYLNLNIHNSNVIVKGSFLYKLFYTNIYVMFGLSYIVALCSYVKGDKALRKKIFFIVVAMLVSIIIGIICLIKGSFYKIQVLPVIMFYMCFYFGYNIIFRASFFTIPYLRSNALNEMRDGYILVDCNNNFLDSNKITKKIFPVLKELEAGTPMLSLKNLPQEFISVITGSLNNEIKITLDDGSFKYYAFTKSIILKKRQSEIICWLIHDITERKLIIKNLEFMANHDSLTGVYNRSTFFKKINNLFIKNKNFEIPFAILILDIDFFKKVNDTYGHIYGDKTLIELVSRINKILRRTDIIARYGGEEFVIYLENVRRKKAMDISEKIRKSIENDIFDFVEVKFYITISIGVSVFNAANHNKIGDVLASADKFLYQAKNSGRNKVEGY